MDAESENLDRALGVPSKVTVRNEVIEVTEITMKDLSAFYATCAPFFAEFADGGRLAKKDGPPTGTIEDFTLFEVICNHSDAFIDACEMTTNASAAFMQTLRPDEFFEIAREVVHVNGSFFVKALAPALIKLARGIEQLGEGLSAVSSLEAIVMRTSKAMV